MDEQESDWSGVLDMDDPMFTRAYGQTRAEDVRHFMARAAFLSEVARDERVKRRQDDWLYETGLGDTALELAASLDAVAVGVGLASRADLWEREDDLGEDAAEAVRDQLSAFLGRAVAAMGEGLEATADLVRDDLRLPWAWLCLELHRLFCASALEYVLAAAVPVDVWGEQATAPLTVGPDVPESEARARLEDWLSRRKAGTKPPGRTPTTADVWDQRARWFYRNRVRVPTVSVRKLAREAFKDRENPADWTATVRDGINEAERVLGLGWRPAEDDARGED